MGGGGDGGVFLGNRLLGMGNIDMHIDIDKGWDWFRNCSST